MSNFIPKKYHKKAITIRVDFDKLDNLDNAAQNFGVSRNDLINQCLDYAMENLADVYKDKK